MSNTKQNIDPMIPDPKTGRYVPNPAFVNDPNREMIPSSTQLGLWVRNPNYNGKGKPLWSEHPVRLLTTFHKNRTGDNHYKAGSEDYTAKKFPDGWHLMDGNMGFGSDAVEGVDFEFIDED